MNQQPRTRREQAEYVVDRLTAFGVRINPCSRIGRMLRILRRREIAESDDPDYPIVLESICDMYQLRLIVDTMDAHKESQEFRVAADLLRKDLVLPQDERKDTPGRNYQFQLYVAALCTNAGLPTRHEEPDVTCTVEGTMFGIAAKRLRSIEAMKENVRTRFVALGECGADAGQLREHRPADRQLERNLDRAGDMDHRLAVLDVGLARTP